MPGVAPDVPAVVLKMVRDDFPHGRLAAVRTLGRLGVHVVGVHESRLTPAAFSRYEQGPIVLPLDDQPGERILAELLALGARLGNRPMLLPTDDIGTLFVDSNAEALAEVFRFPRQPAGLTIGVADKGQLHRLCERLGIGTPNATFPKDRDDAFSWSASAEYPVVVKSMDPRLQRRRPGAGSVAIARDRDGLMDIYDRWEVPEAPNLMFQEYIPGGPDSVWMFNGYFDERSECLASFTGRKTRQHPPGTGATTLGVCESNAEVERLTRTFMKGIGYRGIVDMGWRFDARDQQYKLLDVNPRMGATFRLFVGRDGLDVVRAQYLDLTGQQVAPTEAAEGRRWLVEPFDYWTFQQLRRRGELTWRSWLSSWREVDEFAWFAPDDPAPLAVMAAFFAGKPIYEWGRGQRVLAPTMARLTGLRRPRSPARPSVT